MAEGGEIGTVIRGSLAEGMVMKLADGQSVEDVRAGRFVVIQGEQFRFFSMVTDVTLAATGDQVLLNPPGPSEALVRRVLAGTTTYGTVQLRPMLMLPLDSGEEYSEEGLLPVKTIPTHFSQTFEASRADVNRVFGSEADGRFFTIGAPLEMDDTPVCLNLDRFVERSNGIFGKSGTGKTFLTRLCLCGVIKQRKAVNLVFDMHSEYGWTGRTEDRNRETVRGLKQYFGSDVLVYSLDPESTRRRGAHVDYEIRIPFSEVTIEDVALLEHELNLTSTAVETGYLLLNSFGDGWLAGLLAMEGDELKAFSDRTGAHIGALGALKRKLNVLAKDCRGFLTESVPAGDNAVRSILSALESGKHVIVEFGQYCKPVQYMLVANLLSRRIHQEYVLRTERSLANGSGSVPPLVITIEEAHKFLSPSLAGQTIFGTIAREMRKYNVTLLIVDQRPSGIDDEILSQVGTKLVCLLDDDKDTEAVLTGTPNAAGLRGVLASLETKQQALILGHAVPMPIVIRTRTYDDEEFRKAMNCEAPEERRARLQKDIESDFPD